MNLKAISLGLALTAAALSVSACQSTKAADASPGIVNSKCPMAPADPIDPKVTTQYKGQTVGFCCKGCIPDWNSLTDDQKAARLKASM